MTGQAKSSLNCRKKNEKRKEERMWQAIEAEMEKEREQAEALALIERKKAEVRARAQLPVQE